MFKSLLLSLGFAAIVAAQSAVPSNSTDYVAPSNNTEIILVGYKNAWRYNTIPLTAAAYNVLPKSSSAHEGIGGYLYVTNPQTVGNISSALISLISCDAAVYPGQLTMGDVMDLAVGTLTASGGTTGVRAIILYSTSQDYCNLTSPIPNSNGYVYSMTSVNDTQRLLTQLEGTYGFSDDRDRGYIETAIAYQNNNGTYVGSAGGHGTAVAMIILYVVTGLITLMFIVIIITGAVRAHRHPERYGPRHVFGRPRQSRARGLARAMLETLPIVKFGEHQDLAKHGEVELAEGQDAMRTRGTVQNSQVRDDAPRPEGRGDSFDDEKEAAYMHEPHSSDLPSNVTGAATSSAAIPTATIEPDSDAGLVCSICTDDFAAGEDIRVLPCNHRFHPACVDPWLLDVSSTCPLCRVDLRPAADRTSTDDHYRTGMGADGALPPPLDPSSTRRRDMMMAIFLNRSPEEMQSRTQRVAALRRIRQANVQVGGNERTTGSRAAAGDLAGGEEDSRRRHLLRGMFARRMQTPEVA